MSETIRSDAEKYVQLRELISRAIKDLEDACDLAGEIKRPRGRGSLMHDYDRLLRDARKLCVRAHDYWLIHRPN